MSTDALPLPDLSTLPDDTATLRQLVLQLLEALRGKDTELSKLQHHMDLLLRRLYGRSSEKIDPLQLLLFSAAAQDAAATVAPPAVVEAETNHGTRPGHGRRPKPDHLKRVDVVHDLTEGEKQALAGDGQLVPIGEEITEQYEWQPSSLYIVRHIQKKYARQPQLLESGDGLAEKNIIAAPKPPAPIPGGIAGPGLIAEVVTNRFVDHLPFHRQERRFGRHGFPFSRQTTDGWALDVAERWFVPLMDVLLEDVLAASSLNTDDTPVDVRDAHGKQRYQGRFWTYVGDDLHPHTVLRYTPNHTRDGPGGPAEVLKNYSGFVQADAFSGYDAIYRRLAGPDRGSGLLGTRARQVLRRPLGGPSRGRDRTGAHRTAVRRRERAARTSRSGWWPGSRRTCARNPRRAAGAVGSGAETVRRLAGSRIAAGVAQESPARGAGLHPQPLDGFEPVRAPRSIGDRQQCGGACVAWDRQCHRVSTHKSPVVVIDIRVL